MKWKRRLTGPILAALMAIGSIETAEAALGRAALEALSALKGMVIKPGAKEAAEDFVVATSERSLLELVERVEQEGGERLLKRLVALGGRHGVQALDAVRTRPREFITALDSLPEEMVAPALRALRTNPDGMASLLTAHGPVALRVAGRHPGVAPHLSARFGGDGLELAERLSTDEAVRLAGLGKSMEALSVSDRRVVMNVIAAGPGKVLTFLEKHRTLVLTSGGVASLALFKDEIIEGVALELGPDGRLRRQAATMGQALAYAIADRLHSAAGACLFVVAVFLAVISGWTWWRRRSGGPAARSEA